MEATISYFIKSKQQLIKLLCHDLMKLSPRFGSKKIASSDISALLSTTHVGRRREGRGGDGAQFYENYIVITQQRAATLPRTHQLEPHWADLWSVSNAIRV